MILARTFDWEDVASITRKIAAALPDETQISGALVDGGYAIGVGVEFEGRRTAVRITDPANANPRLMARSMMHLLTN